MIINATGRGTEGGWGWSGRGRDSGFRSKTGVFEPKNGSFLDLKLMVHPLPGGHFSDWIRQEVPAESPVNPLLIWCPLTVLGSGGVGGVCVRVYVCVRVCICGVFVCVFVCICVMCMCVIKDSKIIVV